MNLPASVRQQLYNLSREKGDDFQRLLTQFVLERLLFRLSCSAYAESFILKGALVFLCWMDEPHRRTRDIDLLGSGNPSAEQLAALFRDLCDMDVVADGLRFDSESVSARTIREDSFYGGIRITLVAYLDKARIHVQVDVGFGDAVTPEPLQIEFPTLLNFPAPQLRAYSQETVIAEKLYAMVALDMGNSRMKDFFDVWMLSRKFTFDGQTLAEAIAATFMRRGLPIPATPPAALSADFWASASKQSQWKAFVTQSISEANLQLTLQSVVMQTGSFLLPILNALHKENPFPHRWDSGGPWK